MARSIKRIAAGLEGVTKNCVVELPRLELGLLDRGFAGNGTEFERRQIAKRTAIFTHRCPFPRDNYNFLHLKIIAVYLMNVFVEQVPLPSRCPARSASPKGRSLKKRGG
jgi:hypothetical protein